MKRRVLVIKARTGLRESPVIKLGDKNDNNNDNYIDNDNSIINQFNQSWRYIVMLSKIY